MQPQFATKPAFTVVGMLLRATPMTPEIPRLWDRFVSRIEEVPHLAEPYVSYGLMDHFDVETSQFDYMAGCSVEQVDELPPGMSRWDVPAATYVVFEATVPTLGQTMHAIYNEWFPTSGYRQTAGLYFERYGEDFSPENPESTLSIYIPVTQQPA